jgi:hypothetical protein
LQKLNHQVDFSSTAGILRQKAGILESEPITERKNSPLKKERLAVLRALFSNHKKSELE